MRRSRLKPAVVLGAVSAACLVVFLATIPLPRVDGQLVGGDGAGYYAYLPSVVLDRDLDFANQYAALLPPGHHLLTARTPTGLSFNYWPIGPALLWLPFFLLAHGLALVLTAAGVAIRLDGCGYWHQAFVITGNIAYGGAALWLAFDVARRVTRQSVRDVGGRAGRLRGQPGLLHDRRGVARACRGGVRREPLLRGLAADARAPWVGPRGHARRAGRPGGRRSDAGRAAGGRSARRRPGGVVQGRPAAGPGRRPWRRRAAPWCRWPLAAVVVYSPQFLVSATLYGTWWRPPQLYAGWQGVPQFAWSSPRFWSVLFSPESGLLVWHPIFAFALLGALPLWRRDRTLAAALVGGVLAQAYVLGGWFDWAQGQSFGGRSFVSCLPLFVAGLAALIDATRRALAARPLARRALLAGTAITLVAANLLLAVEFRFDLASTGRRPTWHDLGARRVTFLIEKLQSLAR